jgi:hypothetical protein
MTSQKPMQRRAFLFAVAGLAAFPVASHAADEGLYAAPPAADSALIRLLDARGALGIAAMIGGKEIAAAGGVTPYLAVPAGSVAIEAGEASGEITAEAGRFYTVAMFANGAPSLLRLEDRIIDNPSKALITLYNFGESEASVRAVTQNATVIAPVAAGASASREINAVTLDLEISSGAPPHLLNDVALRRRGALSIIRFRDGSVAAEHNAALP